METIILALIVACLAQLKGAGAISFFIGTYLFGAIMLVVLLFLPVKHLKALGEAMAKKVIEKWA